MYYSAWNGAAGTYPYATDFRDYATGAQLDAVDWTLRVNGGTTDFQVKADSASLSGKTADFAASSPYSLITWDRLGSSVTDFQVLCLLKFDTTPDTTGGTGPCGRMSSDGEDGYNCTFVLETGSNKIELAEFTGTIYQGNHGGRVVITLDTSNRFWVRYTLAGTAMSAKFWQFGSAEPSSATVSGTDGTYTSGRVGFQIRDYSVRVDYYAVATGTGKAAPFPNG